MRERAQLNRIDPCRIKLPEPEDRKRQTLRCRLLYTVTIIFCPTVFGLVAELHQKCILSAEFYKCRNADAKSHTYTSIPQLSSPFSLVLTIFLPLPRAFLSLFHAFCFSHSLTFSTCFAANLIEYNAAGWQYVKLTAHSFNCF